MIKLLPALLIITAIVTGCSDDSEKGVNQEAVKISATDVGKWPFTFDSAIVRCEYQPKAVVEADGKFYALNGVASPQTPPSGFVTLTPDVQEWKDNPDIPGTKVDISDVRNKVQETCNK